MLILDLVLSIIDFIVDVAALAFILYTFHLMKLVRQNAYRNERSLGVFEGEREWLREQMVEIVEFIEMSQNPSFKHDN